MKKQIRKQILDRRNSLSPQEASELSNKIQARVLSWEKFMSSSTIMLYYNYKNEAGTTKLIDECFKLGKRLVLPKVVKETRDILSCLVENLQDFTKGAYGIIEPRADKLIDPTEIDLVIIPGVAFDEDGNRIGHGAGYYDKFLENFSGTKAGICYEFQIVENTYPDQYDIKMDFIITEQRIITISK